MSMKISDQLAFSARGVRKHFGSVKALDGVTLEAKAGTIFGLLGPNGAGKTTLVRALATLLAPDKGSLKVLGVDVAEDPEGVRSLIGLAGQYAAVDEFLTGYENIYITGRLYGLTTAEAKRRTNAILERLSLTDAANRPVRTYSGGMRRRLDLGASLVGEAQVILLDEPTTGLDPRTRLELWQIIRDLVSEGRSIVLTTQYLEEADELADRIAVLNKGKIIAEGTSDELKARLGGDVVELEFAQGGREAQVLEAVKAIAAKAPKVEDEGKRIIVPVARGTKDLLVIVQALGNIKVDMTGISLHRPSLDDVFLALTGERTEDTEKPTSGKKGGRS